MAAKFKFKPKRCYDGGTIGFLNNGQRAKAAEAGVQGFLTHVGESDPDFNANVTDLVANLGHLCDREGKDFRSILCLAEQHWRVER